MKTWHILMILVLGTATVAPRISGQTLQRDGLWFGLGVGGSSTRLTCQVCSSERSTGLAGYAQLGTTLSPQTRVGLEGTGWWKDDQALQQRVGSLAAVAYFYPGSQAGLFFKGGPSLFYYRATDDEDQVNSRSYGMVVGLGVELSTGGRWMLTPGLTVHASSFGRLEADEAIVSRDVNLSLIQLTIGIASR